jgi:hypothetical protein
MNTTAALKTGTLVECSTCTPAHQGKIAYVMGNGFYGVAWDDNKGSRSKPPESWIVAHYRTGYYPITPESRIKARVA